MKSKTPKAYKPYKLQVYFSRKADYDSVRKAAQIKDLKLSHFIRASIIAEARRIVAEHAAPKPPATFPDVDRRSA